jgi:adenylate cyclase
MDTAPPPSRPMRGPLLPRAARGGGLLVPRLRLLSGLTLYAFVLTHLGNHALGLISLDALRAGQALFVSVWHSLPGALLLALAALTHLSLVLGKQIARPTLRMPWIEGLRILLGITTLLGLSLHATPMVLERLPLTGSGQPVAYGDFIPTLSGGDHAMLWNQLILVIAAWTHGCIGLHLWLRLRAGYRRWMTLWAITAVLVPLLALLGVLSAARAISSDRSASEGYGASSSLGYDSGHDGRYDGGYSGSYGSGYGGGSYGGNYSGGGASYDADPLAAKDPPSWWARLLPADPHAAQSVSGLLLVVALLFLVAVARWLTLAWKHRHGLVTVRYPQGHAVKAVRGASVLDISRMGGVPHASVCGGRGRCSTCRVHVDAGWETLPPPQEGEQKVLLRIHAPERVRLACQLCPAQDVAVTPLLPADAHAQDALPYDPMMFGVEQEMVILFADLRGFTQLSESKLPYDVVHILNQYFAEMGAAIESAGGYLDKFIGDGIMALFGLHSERKANAQTGARQAMVAARAMGEKLQVLNARLAQDLATPLRLGLGIHAGPAIVGEMGYGRATTLTAIGDAVNVASRLESATKEVGCELLISAEVAQRGSLDLSAFPRQEITVRGRAGPLSVYAVPRAADLPLITTP